MYLRTLEGADKKIVNRLATYPWINAAVSGYGEEQKASDWYEEITERLEWPCPPEDDDPDAMCEKAEACISFQTRFGVRALILPAPLTQNPETDFQCEARWIDCGLNAIPSDNDLPAYATLAISDHSLMHSEPDKSELLNTIIDQITARTDLDGVYIVLHQVVPSDSKYLLNSKAAWALLRLCYDLGTRASLDVIVNYADVFGFACLAAGANSFCTGIETKARRLCFGDFEPVGGGRAYPKFYSSSLMLRLSPRDIANKIAPKRLTRYLDSDRTEFSAPLLDAVNLGQSSEHIDAWQERANNVTASRAHFVQNIIQKTDALMASEDKITFYLNWLQDAERDVAYLTERLEGDPLGADHRHISAWRSAFESFLAQYHLL